jgi:hypothetical protein
MVYPIIYRVLTILLVVQDFFHPQYGGQYSCAKVLVTFQSDGDQREVKNWLRILIPKPSMMDVGFFAARMGLSKVLQRKRKN